MAEPFAPTSLDQEKRNWIPIIIGAVVVAVVVAALAIFGRSPAPKTLQEDPYAAKLQVSDAQLEGLENFVGGTVNNLDFKLTNA
jgi:anti-sigma-K factor RskA